MCVRTTRRELAVTIDNLLPLLILDRILEMPAGGGPEAPPSPVSGRNVSATGAFRETTTCMCNVTSSAFRYAMSLSAGGGPFFVVVRDHLATLADRHHPRTRRSGQTF